MKTAICITSFALLLAALSSGCSDRGAEVADEPVVDDNHVVPLRVTPESGRIGNVVSIRDGAFAVATDWNIVSFKGANDYLIPDSGSQQVIHTFVPFGAISGPISVRIGLGKGQTQVFQVTETVDTTRITVAWYDLSSPVTASDAIVVDRLGIREPWKVEVHGDTVHINRTYSPGEDFCEHHFLLMNVGANRLPRLIAAWTVRIPDYPGTWIDTIRAGILKVQNWDTSAVMSGRFFGNPSLRDMLNGTVSFWVDRAK